MSDLEATQYPFRHYAPNDDLPIVAASGQVVWWALSNAQDIFFVPVPLCVKHSTHFPKCPCIFQGDLKYMCVDMGELRRMLIPHRPARKD